MSSAVAQAATHTLTPKIEKSQLIQHLELSRERIAPISQNCIVSSKLLLFDYFLGDNTDRDVTFREHLLQDEALQEGLHRRRGRGRLRLRDLAEEPWSSDVERQKERKKKTKEGNTEGKTAMPCRTYTDASP